MRKSHLSNTFKPQTKKATQNTKTQGGKSQLFTAQKSQLKFFSHETEHQKTQNQRKPTQKTPALKKT
jgi:hypothetical protein